MRRSFTYKARLSRTVAQAAEGQLRLCAELYNAALEERKIAYKRARKPVGYFTQSAELPGLKEVRPEFKAISCMVLQNVLKRVDLAFAAFFRRVKSGDAPGYPRFKPARTYNSLTFRRSGWKRSGNRLTLKGIGILKLFWSRDLQGTVKTVTLRRDSCGDWWVAFSCDDVPASTLAPVGSAVGVDVGLESFLTTSDGEHVANPRPMRTEQAAVARAQRRVSKRAKGGHRRRKAVRLLAKRHRKVARVRRDFHRKTAIALVRKYDTIAVEDLNVRGLARGMLAKSVHDVGWGQFVAILAEEAEKATRVLVAVNPRGTSQACSDCGAVPDIRKGLGDRLHACPACGYTAHRDYNSARNILALGLLTTGQAGPSASCRAFNVAA